MIHFVGWIIVGFVAVVMVLNGTFMLISPSAWFRLPSWLRAQGTLTQDRYSSGWGALQLPIAGGLIIASIIWVLHSMFSR